MTNANSNNPPRTHQIRGVAFGLTVIRLLYFLYVGFSGVVLHAAVARVPGAADGGAFNDWSHDEFQFVFRFENAVTPPGRKSSTKSTVYLYVPVAAKKLRALLLLQENVVEQMISVHPAIRRVCDAQEVAIAWCTPGFDMVFKDHAEELHAIIQRQFREFGRSIGYPELGDIPLITFGHSNTTAYAQIAAEARPDRVLAVIATHGWNGVNSLNHYRGPVLMDVGTFWEQKQQTLGNGSNKGVASLAEVQKRLQRGWLPVSIVEEYGSGHFDYSEPVVGCIALFIDKAIRARLAPDGTLKDLNPDDGWIALLPEFPTGPVAIRRYAEASSEQRASCPWYFDREMAEAAVNRLSLIQEHAMILRAVDTRCCSTLASERVRCGRSCGPTCIWTKRSLTRCFARARRRTRTSERCRSGRRSSSN